MLLGQRNRGKCCPPENASLLLELPCSLSVSHGQLPPRESLNGYDIGSGTRSGRVRLQNAAQDKPLITAPTGLHQRRRLQLSFGVAASAHRLYWLHRKLLAGVL